MTTAAPPRPTRRVPSASSPPAPASSISRGATARSAVSPRVSTLKPTAVRRGSIKGPSQSPTPSEGQADLSDQLKHETEQKEQLLVQVQDKDQLISSLGTENESLSKALHAAEARLNDLYSDQGRSEMELAQRIDINEKLRAQVAELAQEKRDLQRRYNEEATTFEAERQAFYDNEQHLKSRIQSLTQARRQPEASVSFSDVASIAESVTDVEEDIESNRPQTPKQDLYDPDQEPAEMTSLRLELSTLSTSYSSLQSTLILLQTQLVDLKRVNNELQEENESYMILLRERTLSGRFDLRGQVGGGSSDEEEDNDVGSLRSTGRSTLERVEEEVHEGTLEHELEPSLEPQDSDSISSHTGRKKRGRNRGTSHSPSSGPRGESLADLPITGPGLDLAAELGRAENKDILEDSSLDDHDPLKTKSRKDSNRRGALTEGFEPSASSSDLDALRTEVKALKDANKALSLYASKIIDRIISQEGFEHVLAADYEKQAETPSTAHPSKAKSKTRPQSIAVDKVTMKSVPTPALTTTPTISPPIAPKAQRRSMSFDWRGFNLFSGDKKPEPNLRPLTLTPGASPVTGGRKLDTQEDEDDRRERERINATMKLMGIQPQIPAPMQKSVSSPGPSQMSSPVTATSRRFSLFGSRSVPSDNNSDTLSIHSTQSLGGKSPVLGGDVSPNLTREALEHAEAQNSLAALDAHERSLSAELARGSGSGFTEIQPRGSRRSRRSAGGSGSTVWSAGIAEDD